MARQGRLTVTELINKFLAAQKVELATSSYKWYCAYLIPFQKKFGPLPVGKLSPGLMRRWVATWPDGSQYNAARAVARACNWATANMLIDASPIRGYQKPQQTRRQATVTPADYVLCLRKANSLRDAVKFLWHTGARPQELRAIEGRWINDRRIVFPLAHSKGRRTVRKILLDDMAFRIATRLAKQNKSGPIFRNADGGKWSKSSLGLAFHRLRARTGIKNLCAYSFRHSYITRLLERGVDPATVAAISGNSTAMVLEWYNHVGSNEGRLLSIVAG